MKRQITPLLLAAGMIGCATMVPALVTAQEADASTQGAIDFRESTMTIYKWYLQPMGGMVKGKIPFDAKVFADKAAGLATAASLDLTAGFPKDSHEDTEAKPEIWQNWDDFVAKHKALQKESQKLQEVAAGGDMDAMKEQFGATAKTCKGCHDDFREKKK